MYSACDFHIANMFGYCNTVITEDRRRNVIEKMLLKGCKQRCPIYRSVCIFRL